MGICSSKQAASSNGEVPHLFGANYRIISLLGTGINCKTKRLFSIFLRKKISLIGANATVHKAKSKQTGEFVAVKKVDRTGMEADVIILILNLLINIHNKISIGL